MYVRGTLCFMLQAKWTPGCPDWSQSQTRLKRLNTHACTDMYPIGSISPEDGEECNMFNLSVTV